MEVVMKKLILSLTLIVGVFVHAGSIYAGINVSGNYCNTNIAVHQGREDQTVTVTGLNGLQVKEASVSGSGVFATVMNKTLTSVKIQFKAYGNAATGNRTVTIKSQLGSDTFTITVIQKASISGATLPTFTGPYQSANITLQGSGLTGLDAVNVEVQQTPNTPVLDSAGQPIAQAVTGTAVVNTSSASHAGLTVNFFKGGQPVQLTEARVKLILRANQYNFCSGFHGQQSGKLEYTVTLTAPLGPNYVQSITFPYGSSFNVGSLATIQIDLQRPASSSSQGGEIVYWKPVPTNAFEQSPGGTPYNPNALNSITIPNGNTFAQITIKVKLCPGRAATNTVKIQTWRINTNTTQPPEFKEAQFIVNCLGR
jgi:hypothetical protein